MMNSKRSALLFGAAAMVGGLAFLPTVSNFGREAMASTVVSQAEAARLESAGTEMDMEKPVTTLTPQREYGNSNSHHGSNTQGGFHKPSGLPGFLPRPRPRPPVYVPHR
jgi:hypothetical protein